MNNRAHIYLLVLICLFEVSYVALLEVDLYPWNVRFIYFAIVGAIIYWIERAIFYFRNRATVRDPFRKFYDDRAKTRGTFSTSFAILQSLPAICIGLMMALPMAIVGADHYTKAHPLYTKCRQAVEADKDLIKFLGGIEGYGLATKGTTRDSWNEPTISMRIYGHERMVSVVMYLTCSDTGCALVQERFTKYIPRPTH